MEQYILQLGAVGIIFALAIKEFFAYLKTKKENGVAGKIEVIGNNHLTHIYQELQRQTLQHEKQTEVLTRIATILEERR